MTTLASAPLLALTLPGLVPFGHVALAQSVPPTAEFFIGPVNLFHYLVLSAALFSLGVVGFLSRRNLIIMFLCTEMMFQAAGIALVAFSKFHLNHTGEVFVIFVLTIAAAEAAMALALVVLLFKRRETLDAERWALLKG